MSWLETSIKNSGSLKDHFKLHGIDIFIKDPLPKTVNPDEVFSYISHRVPSHLFRAIDIVYIGQFDSLKEKEVNAIYSDGAIYLTNIQDNNMDAIDDIVHEIAHSVEETNFDLIYGDTLLKKEFLGKRQRLYHTLSNQDHKPPSKIRNTYMYDEQIDLYLYKEVGYDNLWYMITGLFPSPYSATSLREYFAIGFEEFFIKDKRALRKECPVLYSKLEELEFVEES